MKIHIQAWVTSWDTHCLLHDQRNYHLWSYGGEHVGLAKKDTCYWSTNASYTFLFPLQPPVGGPGLLPTAAARGNLSGNLAATTWIEWVKTNTAFSFVGRIDLPPSIKIHRIWILNNKVAVVLALTDWTGSACKIQDILFSAGWGHLPLCAGLWFPSSALLRYHFCKIFI